MIREGGQGGSEIRLWIAALAAGKAAGGAPALVDYYSDQTTIGVGAGIVHAPAT
jgi:2,3-dihydroxyphenylpropionate 1,2-dioxygenase